MIREYLMWLFDYNYWANERILRAAAKVNHAQFVAPTTHSHGSLRGTLVHTLMAEWMWLSRWQGVSPTERLREEDYPTIDALVVRWNEEEQKMRAFLAMLREGDLLRRVRYTNTHGAPFERPLWEMMVHIVNHGTQHRSEAAAILTELGHSPGDWDLIYFADERRPVIGS